MVIFDERCLTEGRVKELYLFLRAQKIPLNKAWLSASANPEKAADSQQLSRILEAIELCNLSMLSPSDYALIASLSSIQDA